MEKSVQTMEIVQITFTGDQVERTAEIARLQDNARKIGANLVYCKMNQTKDSISMGFTHASIAPEILGRIISG